MFFLCVSLHFRKITLQGVGNLNIAGKLPNGNPGNRQANFITVFFTEENSVQCISCVRAGSIGHFNAEHGRNGVIQLAPFVSGQGIDVAENNVADE